MVGWREWWGAAELPGKFHRERSECKAERPPAGAPNPGLVPGEGNSTEDRSPGWASGKSTVTQKTHTKTLTA
jgi:hypothetical protein